MKHFQYLKYSYFSGNKNTISEKMFLHNEIFLSFVFLSTVVADVKTIDSSLKKKKKNHEINI